MRDLFIDKRPLVMGILNVTPDSFYDGGNNYDTDKALINAKVMLAEGADIIDIGGESTRPGYTPVSIDEECSRVIPVIQKLKNITDKTISIDTTKYEVAKEAVAIGAEMINDISCLGDERLAEIALENDIYYVLMHNREMTADIDNPYKYTNFETDYMEDMNKGINKLKKIGMNENRIILDPGVGFAKTTAYNLYVIKKIKELKQLGFPVLLAASRKSVIGDVLGLDKSDRLEGTLAIAAYGMMNGADIVRVHDVKEHVRILKMLEAICTCASFNK